MKRFFIAACFTCFSLSTSAAGFNQQELNGFIKEMVEHHSFDEAELIALFKKAQLQEKVLESISRPAESMEWHNYRKIFLTDSRVTKGVKFWQENHELLLQVEEAYGVDREVIVAIIGVETYYGKHTGKYRVIDSVATLAFNYPKRSEFFRSELKEFLLFTRELDVDPLTLKGSYAGAMGMPQFISSSFQAYAVDFDKDGSINIWDNKADIFASVANYFKHHKWSKGEPIAVPAVIDKAKGVQTFIDAGMKPSLQLNKIRNSGIELEKLITGNPECSLLEYQQKKHKEYWVGFDNFYTITRYNRSQLYAMAVFQLSQQIREAYIDAVEKQ